MVQSHACVNIHLVFSTKGRREFIVDAIRSDLHAYMSAISRREGADVHEVGGIEDHVHMLVHLPRTLTLASLAEKIKSGSSKWIKTKGTEFQLFAWQNGYGVFSVSQSQVPCVRRYIQEQRAHHRKWNFQEELRALLTRHGISFDERDLVT